MSTAASSLFTHVISFDDAHNYNKHACKSTHQPNDNSLIILVSIPEWNLTAVQ